MGDWTLMAASMDLPPGYSFGGSATTDIDGLCTYTLQGIVMEIATRAGMDPRTVDASQLANILCRGYTITNAYAASACIASLSQIFLFDPSNYDGIVHFPIRGADAVATLSEDDFVITDDSNDTGDPESQTTRSDDITIPARLNLNYFDVSGGLATSLQISERDGDPRATGSQDLQTVVVMNADEAKRVVKINHMVMVEDQKAQFEFILSDKWLALTCADNVFVQYNGRVRRIRMTQIDLNNGMQSYTALQDRQSAYMSNVQGYPAYVPSPPPDLITGATVIEPLDIHIIRDQDDSLGCYIAVSGILKGWVGAQIDVSLDGGATYFDSFQATTSAVIGTLGSALGDHPIDYPDTINSCEVDIEYPNSQLTSVDPTQLYNRANLAIIGNEVINFADAEETSHQGTYILSTFLRGRNGTDAVAHSTGERFVLLDRNSLYYLPAQLSYLGMAITLRATSLNGDPDTDITTVTFTYTGQSQTEYAPSYLMARRDSSNAIISWQNVGKLGAGAHTAPGAYFSGYTIVLTDGTRTQTFQQLTTGLTVDISLYSGPITCTVQQMNQLTGAGPAATVVF
jgi:Putative phage tail protein